MSVTPHLSFIISDASNRVIPECLAVPPDRDNDDHERVETFVAAIDLLYDLVDEGMNLHPKVYSRVQRRLREFKD